MIPQTARIVGRPDEPNKSLAEFGTLVFGSMSRSNDFHDYRETLK